MIFFPAADFASEIIYRDLVANWRMTLENIFSVITLTELTWYLPMGVMDAVLAGPVLLLLLVGRFPARKVTEYESIPAGRVSRIRTGIGRRRG